ncbi:MAG: bifunctional adenosylcobinamide kinase/adenosylcobinamide-phosphate guanylyltransferase [Dehalococcoidia bacterium]|nr:bifunctional adenosylcobinamide kinase/adenosylcobinamide-phosphate guanylyltransferase [Dehalococcoidia bacterium]
MGFLTFVTGGARSGKSLFAEDVAARNRGPVVYLATMEALDEETTGRIARHRVRRSLQWLTIEEPIDLVGALRVCDPAATVLLDCVSLWVANVFMRDAGAGGESPETFERVIATCLAAADGILAEQQRRPGSMIAVSNEVGWGIVPADWLSRYYRDALGLVNQRLAAAADEAVLLASGLPLWLKRQGRAEEQG